LLTVQPEWTGLAPVLESTFSVEGGAIAIALMVMLPPALGRVRTHFLGPSCLL